MSADPIMLAIQEAMSELESGLRSEAREHFEAIWVEIQHDPRPLHECVLAHFMADTQEDPLKELEWDQRALAAATHCTDAEAKQCEGNLSIAAFLPSLHLNLGDDYLRLGDIASSGRHLELGLTACSELPDTPYADLIRNALQGLAERLNSSAQRQSGQ